MESTEKTVTVISGTKRKRVLIKFTSLTEVRNAIRSRFEGLSDDFYLLALSGDERLNIDDEEDLRLCMDSETFIAQEPRSSLPSSGPPGLRPPPPPYGQVFPAGTGEQVPCAAVAMGGGRDFETVKAATRAVVERTEQGLQATVDLEECSSVHKIPTCNDPIVAKAIKELADDADMEAILHKMRIIAKSLKLAYYGAVENPKMRKLVQHIQFRALDFCKDCNLTIVKFKHSATDILKTYGNGFLYMMEGFDDEARKRFQTVKETAGNMAEETTKWGVRCQVHINDIENALQGIDWNPKISKKTGSDVKRKSSGDTSHASGRPETILQKIALKLKSISKRAGPDIENSGAFGGNIQVPQEADPPIEHRACAPPIDQPEPEEPMKMEDVQPTLVADALSKILTAEQQRQITETDYRTELESSSEKVTFDTYLRKIETDEEGKDALHCTHTAFKSLQSSMKVAQRFWEQLRMDCERKFDSLMAQIRQVDGGDEVAAGGPRGKDFFRSHAFRREVQDTYARWVAMETLCGKMQTKMRGIEDSLHSCVTANPTVEEARARRAELLEELNNMQDCPRVIQNMHEDWFTFSMN